MSEVSDKSRFDREIDVAEDYTPVDRFVRLDRGIEQVAKAILEGVDLELRAEKGSIHVKQGPLEGLFHSSEQGLLALGDAADDEPFEANPGPCPGDSPLDRYLLEGGAMSVTKLGDHLFANGMRNLPHREYTYNGKTHKVYRKGFRKAKGSDLLVLLKEATEAQEEVLEGSILSD